MNMDTTYDTKTIEMAKKYVWWKSPEDALSDQSHFIAQLMTLGTLEDTRWLRATFSAEELADVLNHPPPGVFTGRAWHYWHIRLGISPIPALPVREIP